MSMNCDQFQDRILELAYGELDEVTDRSLRTHAESCAPCGEALGEIEEVRGLAAQVTEPPVPTHFDDDIMALARAKAKTMAGDRPAAPPSDAERHPALAFILRPQVGIALAACLLVGVMWKTTSAPHETMFETAEGAPFKNAAEKPLPEAEAPLLPEAAAPAVPIQMADGSAADSEAAIREQAARTRAGGAEMPAKSASATLSRTNPTDRLEAKAAPPEANALLGMAAPAQAAQKETAKRKSASAGASASMEMADMDEDMAAASAPAAKMAAPMAASAGDAAPDPFNTAMNHYRAGNCSAAKAGFQRLVDAGTLGGNREALALHTIARCERRTGRCGKALIPYEQLLRSYSTYPSRAEALWEAAACHRRLGHKARARTLLQELSADPAWSAKANSELRTLD